MANQVHHLFPRGMGGSKSKDNIENLIALTMICHEKAERGKDHKKFNNKLIAIKKREFKKNRSKDEKRKSDNRAAN